MAAGAVFPFERAAEVAGLSFRAGLGAVKAEYRRGIVTKRGYQFSASIDLDTFFEAVETASKRWDYAVGWRSEHAVASDKMVWIEAHPASSTGEVQAMLEKLAWLKSKLARPEFSKLVAIEHRAPTAFRWLALTGAIRVRANSQEGRRMAKAGLSQPVRQIELP